MKKEKRKCGVLKKILIVLGIILLLLIVKNIFYVQKNGVVKGVYEDDFQRKYVIYKGNKYFKYEAYLNAHDSVGDKIGFSVRSIFDYIIPVPEIVHYGFWSLEYDRNNEYLIHLEIQSDEILYIREDIVDKLHDNNVLMTMDEYESKHNEDSFFKEDYTKEELNSYVLNDNYGGMVAIHHENGESSYITNKSDMETLDQARNDFKNWVSFDSDILNNNSYQLQFYDNELPVPKLSDYIVVINNQYIYVKLNENDKDNNIVKGTIIEDESALESIMDNGKQIFTKENSVTIDELKYLD